MSEKELTKEESLRLITEMIGHAKKNYSKGGSFHFLLWGWVILFANLGHYYLARFTDFSQPYFVWLITIPAAMVSIIFSIRMKERAMVVSHLDRLYGQVWLSVGVGISIVLFYMQAINFNNNAIILLLAAIGTYISGQMLKFKPLILGSIALWVSSIICFNVPVMDQFLVAAIGILVGYIIPGYLLKQIEK